MVTKEPLRQLTPSEILLIRKHLQLGKKHLDRVLSRKESQEIFSLADEAEDPMESDSFEVIGTASLVLNSVLTATLGAWMGLSGFLGLSLGSKPLFVSLLIFAVGVGGLIGLRAGYQAKKKADRAIEEKKLYEIERHLISLINQKRRIETEEKTIELIRFLEERGIRNPEIQEPFLVHEACLNWLDQMQALDPQAEPLKKGLQNRVENKRSQNTSEWHHILRKLGKAPSQPPLKWRPWIRANWRGILSGLVPTLLGVFSSLFVYLGGAPELAHQMGYEGFFHILMQPKMKLIELTTALLITLYFAISYLYANHKSYLRDQTLSQMRLTLEKEENAMEGLDDRLLKIKEALDLLKNFLTV